MHGASIREGKERRVAATNRSMGRHGRGQNRQRPKKLKRPLTIGSAIGSGLALVLKAYKYLIENVAEPSIGMSRVRGGSVNAGAIATVMRIVCAMIL